MSGVVNKRDGMYVLLVLLAGLVALLSLAVNCAVVVSSDPGYLTLVAMVVSIFAFVCTQCFEMYGLLRFGAPRAGVAPAAKCGSDVKLTVCIVSTGRQLSVLTHTVEVAHKVLSARCPNFEIEVVVEPLSRCWSLSHLSRVVVLEVDRDFATRHDSRYKARALEYARRMRSERGVTSDWVLHLDEESLLTESAIHGVSNFAVVHGNHPAIGQGEIHYNSVNYGSNLLTAACDSWRAGSDLGLQRAQMEGLGTMYVGLHGSFLLLPREVEERIGFDFGPEGSVAEDAFFAIAAAEAGVPFKWIEGIVREQSPQNLLDILRQRRRWLQGTMKTLMCQRFSINRRAVLGVHILLKIVALCLPFTALICLPEAVSGGLLDVAIVGLVIVVLFSVDPAFLIGLYRNIQTLDYQVSRKRRLFLTVLSLAPLAVVVNRIAVPIFSLLTRETNFFVVDKDEPKPEAL